MWYVRLAVNKEANSPKIRVKVSVVAVNRSHIKKRKRVLNINLKIAQILP